VTQTSSPDHDPELADPPGKELADPPTQFAELTITFGPPPWSLKGTVPPDQAHHLITTVGIAGSAISGIAGTVLILRIAPHLTSVALAVLALAAAAMVLTAICSSIRAGGKSKRRRKIPENQAHPPVQRLSATS
jgi:small-conductance mechanosensitive channel